MSIYYTNAPMAYDYGCTDELDPDVGRLTSGMDQEKPVRKISIRGDSFHAESQIMRNSSGLYPTLTEEQWEEWLEAGFATARDESCPQCHGLGTVPNTNDASFNVRMKCPSCNDEEDESDYSRGMDPDSWCADDALKGE